jgi:hypothetical protein
LNDDQVVRDGLDSLVPLSDEVAEWDDVLARAARMVGEVDRGRVQTPSRRDRRLPLRPMLVAAGAISVTIAAAALAVSAPWRGGPDIVGRAAAAIENPTPGQILYERIRIRASIPPGVARRLPRRLRTRVPQGWVGQARMWIDGAPPRRFRFTITGRWTYANGAVMAAPPAEIGGRLSSFDGLAYNSRFRVLLPVAFDYPTTQSVLDPAAFVKAALTSRRAKVEGTTVIHGRKAIRIRVRARIYGQLEPVADYFVDAQTYRPIRVVITEGIAPGDGPTLPGMPLTSLTGIEQATVPSFGGNYVFDFIDYTHLASTAANQELTDIKAMHPHAKTD